MGFQISGFIPGMHFNRVKEKENMIISTEAEKACGKIKHSK